MGVRILRRVELEDRGPVPRYSIWPAGDFRPRPVCGVTEAEASIRDFHKFTGGKMVFLPIGEPIDVALRNAF